MGSSSSKPNKEKLLGTPTLQGSNQTFLFNGLLLRIIDERSGTWGFFNNSKDYEFHISYLFTADSQLQPLNQTMMEMQDDGILCEVIVYPLETKKFVQGDVGGFESKIEARPLSEEYFQSHPKLDERKYYRRLIPPKASDF